VTVSLSRLSGNGFLPEMLVFAVTQKKEKRQSRMEEDKQEYIQFLIRDAQYIAGKLHQTNAYPENGIHKNERLFSGETKDFIPET
jgi:hypothetical protein